MHYLPGIFALLVGIAGWFYLFYSRAAHNLSAIEDPHLNRLRIRLRRVNGIVLLALAACFYAAYYGFNEPQDQRSFVFVLMTILLLLMATVILALMDVRLTSKLRRRRQNRS